ncbi:MAG TPA: prolipoprotein diacylglyceryl transferase family protein, partial [Kofleriaceae bacterium]|nr:prolipoprotein diacylglyceryl transferase family protein [Kofleriaceae bacterium]
EFLYLVPVNAIVLYLAFRPSKRSPAGFVTVLIGILYAPVRFFLDFLRPEDTDPRYAGLTFAQWSAIVAFCLAIYVASRILKTGKPAETVARTSGEAQERLRIILREDEEAQKQHVAGRQTEAERKKAEIARARAEREREDAELAAAEAARARKDAAGAKDTGGEADASATETETEAEAEAEAEAAGAAETTAAAGGGATARPAAARPGGAGKKKNKNRRR